MKTEAQYLKVFFRLDSWKYILYDCSVFFKLFFKKNNVIFLHHLKTLILFFYSNMKTSSLFWIGFPILISYHFLINPYGQANKVSEARLIIYHVTYRQLKSYGDRAFFVSALSCGMTFLRP